MFRWEHHVVNDEEEGRRNSSDFNEKAFSPISISCVSHHINSHSCHLRLLFVLSAKSNIASVAFLVVHTQTHTHTWNTHITNSTSVSSKFNSSSRMNFSYLWGIKRSWGNIKIEMFSFDCVTGTQRAFQFSSTLLRTFFCCVWIQFLCYCLWIYQVLLRLEMSMIHGIFIFRLSV